MIEEWKEIPFNPNYEVSNLGRVKNKKTKKLLKERDNGHGYKKVHFQDKTVTGKYYRRCFYIHRLVAMAFLPNKNNLPEINHKDGNKNNNHVSNLEWCTSQQNKEHAVRYGLRPISDKMRETSRKLAYKLHKRLTHLDYVKIGQKSRETLMNKSTQERNKSKMLVWKPIKCIELNKIFCCAKRVKEKLGYNERTITRAIGKSVKAYGFTWKYISNRRFPKSLINSSI